MMRKLGMTYLLQNTFDKSFDYLSKALEIRENIFGEEHKETARSYFRLGILYEKMSNFEKAIYYIDKALLHKKNTMRFRIYPTK